MPTESGLRLFVDGMMQATEPSAEERRAIESQLSEGGPIEEALSAATAVLSGLSACAGIVLVPKREPVLRQFGFVPLSERPALARSEEHTSELQSLMRISYAVFCLKNTTKK